MNSNEIKKYRPEQWWFLSDKWFRLLEFGLILGTLNYFSIKTELLLTKILYWISWFLFYSLIVECGEFIAQKFSDNGTAKKKWLIWLLSMFPTLVFFYIITFTTQLIINGPYK